MSSLLSGGGRGDRASELLTRADEPNSEGGGLGHLRLQGHELLQAAHQVVEEGGGHGHWVQHVRGNSLFILIIAIMITMIIMMVITGDPRGCGQVPTDPQQQGDPHHLGGRDSKSAAVKVPFLIIIKKPASFLHFVYFRGVSRADAGMYVCFVTNPRGGFNYRPAYLTVVPSKALAHLFHEKELLLLQRKFPGTESLVNESPPVLILVICLSVRTNLTSPH